MTDYMEELKQTLEVAAAIAEQNLERAQEQQRRDYNRGTQPRAFWVGDPILDWGRLFPTLPWVPWRGPFQVTQCVSPVWAVS